MSNITSRKNKIQSPDKKFLILMGEWTIFFKTFLAFSLQLFKKILEESIWKEHTGSKFEQFCFESVELNK